MRLLIACRQGLCRTGSEDLLLDSVLTTVTLVVTGLDLSGARPVDPRRNSAKLFFDERSGVVAAGRHSNTFASW